ncbi:hypothetical protein NA57DRAFT_54181 [Rhizodiscina lignyota]|uniref:Uncharacterized protein n=1 Tax=Rhizodiscina lignyota TaxID=1504668 RepID=A0A9P4IIH5_9PEZI|nr:hypothetical protein NA57DRAFT_54181 [Rhizodiscina lignyota]
MGLLKEAVKLGGAYAIVRTGLKEFNKYEENKHSHTGANNNKDLVESSTTSPPPYSQQPSQATRGSFVTADGYVHADYCNGNCGRRCNGTQTNQIDNRNISYMHAAYCSGNCGERCNSAQTNQIDTRDMSYNVGDRGNSSGQSAWNMDEKREKN